MADEAAPPVGGEMGELLRATDWAATALGPIESWPQSLRTAASIVLDSKFPMYLAWGPGYVQLYNDAFRPILGSKKHPAAMGGRAEETFAESWEVIAPLLADVRRGIATGAEDWMVPLDRDGFLEECYFTFAYTPIRDETGGVGGVHVTVSETSTKVVDGRRLRALHELAARVATVTTPEQACAAAAVTLDAHRADAPFAAIYLLSDDGARAHRQAMANLPEDAPAFPAELSLTDGGPWPIARAIESGEPVIVDDLATRHAPLPGGPWPEPARCALVLPIVRTGHVRPSGVLIAGVSPRRPLDRGAREFLDGVTRHLGNAIATSRALEQERAARRNVEEALRAKADADELSARAEHVSRALVDALPDLAWWALPDGFIDFYNRRWYEYTGTTFEQMEGWGWKRVHDPDLVDAVTERWQRSLATGAPFEMEFPLRRADGAMRWFLTRVRPLRDREGTIVRWVGTNTDIHELREARRRAEALLEAVSRSEREAEVQRTRLRSTFMEAPAGIAILSGPEHVFELANPVYRQLVGKTEAQLLARPGRAALPELVEQGVWDLFDRIYATGEPVVHHEFAVKLDRRGDGTLEQAYFHWSAQATRDGTGAIDGVVLFALEVTSQVVARQALAAVLARVPVPIVLLEPGTAQILLSNTAADALWGGPFPRPATDAAHFDTFRSFTPEGEPVPFDRVPAMRAARGEELVSVRTELETPRGRVSLLVDSATVPALPGHPATVVVTFRDVSALVATERALREAVQARDDFLSIASHELNTPLTPLKLQLATLRRSDEWSDKARAKLERADKQIDRLAGLVAELLEVSRITAGRLNMVPERVAVLGVAREIAERIGALADDAPPLSLSGEDAVAWVDRGRLDQVVTNLLTNAIKYGNEKPIAVEVSTAGAFVVLRVRDQGIGIEPQMQRRIFERFERAVSVRHFGGFGLGLWIVRQIVEAWGGTVAVESAPGAGSTFTVTLPGAPGDGAS